MARKGMWYFKSWRCFPHERSRDSIWFEGSNYGQNSWTWSCRLEHSLLSWKHLNGNDYLEMIISSYNYGGILIEGVLVFIRWKLRTWSGFGRNDWCEKNKNGFNKETSKEIFFKKFCLEDKNGVKLGILLWNRGNDVLFAKLLSTFPLINDMNS